MKPLRVRYDRDDLIKVGLLGFLIKFCGSEDQIPDVLIVTCHSRTYKIIEKAFDNYNPNQTQVEFVF